MFRLFCAAALVLLVGFITLPAQAQVDLLPEIRGGIFAQDLGSDEALLAPERISGANVELLFSPPGPGLPLEFRPHLGATLNFREAESFAYTGLSATFRLPLLPVFAEASLGGALHNGSMLDGGTSQRFGCPVLARGSASVGVDVLPGTAVMLTAEHLTDGGLCGGPAEGTTNLGVRLGLRF